MNNNANHIMALNKSNLKKGMKGSHGGRGRYEKTEVLKSDSKKRRRAEAKVECEIQQSEKLMTPIYEDEQSELISAMSALNTHDERNPYTGPFLTDEIEEVKQAQDYLRGAFHLHDNDVYDGEYIIRLDNAKSLLNSEIQGEKLWETHSMIKHALEHIDAAMKVYEGKYNEEK